MMYLLLAVEILLRMFVGASKPVNFAHTPPGAFGNWMVLPVSIIMLIWCLWSGSRASGAQS